MELLKEHAEDTIPDTCRHYLLEKCKTNQIYRLKKEEVNAKTEQLLKESTELYEAVPAELKNTEAFQTLARLIKEQIGDDDTPKEAKQIAPESLQNPHETEATYRKIGNKSYTSYVMNFVEARDNDKKMSIILSYQLEPMS